MLLIPSIIFTAACLLSTGTAAPTCPLDGPVFPKPLRLAESDAVKAALGNLTTTFENITAGAQNYSFSVEVFSAHDPLPLWSISHTAPKLATLNSTGVKEVDSNTVFRLGSLTKIFTIYNFLVNAGDKAWNEPITNYVPELAAIANRSDPVAYVAWNEVTIGGLATQMAGIPRDYALLGELTQTRQNATLLGFPPLTEEETPPCGSNPVCTREQFFNGVALFYPSLAPFTSPAYSNVAFQLLAYALESITGSKFESLMEDTILKSLGLNNTFVRAPEDARGIIPGDKVTTQWSFDLGESLAAGNMYSSTSDISALGRAILDYNLLSPTLTRRWLKPYAFSSDPNAMVGVPWGARRVNLGQPYRHVTAFNKAGNIGMYSSVLIIIPDMDVGISILLAGDLPGNANFGLADIVGGPLLPALEEASRAEAGALYNGHYVFPDSSFNSSMTIATDDQPGLSITQWFSNGTDFSWIATVLQVQYYPITPRIRLYPTGLEGVGPEGGKRVVFKAVFEDAAAPSRGTPMFSTDCGTWVTVESVIYGSAAMDELIFNLDADGNVVSITSPSLRVTLVKEQT
ncbi:beta-lactamase/transpeptidase-like protein [Xylariomycetidae sp. FL2044]|nr:beta-lactamase/transpeptidase-like protein [Xylariomycetidae sp. FL2044]